MENSYERLLEPHDVIYAAYCDVSSQFYIGRTCSPSTRFRQHISDKQSPVHKLAEKYGADHIFFMVLMDGLSRKESPIYEAKYIYEMYGKVDLINRYLPPSNYLVPFCSTKDKTKFYKNSALAIERDIEAGQGCFAGAKNRKRGEHYIRCGCKPYEDLNNALHEVKEK